MTPPSARFSRKGPGPGETTFAASAVEVDGHRTSQ